MTFTSLLRKSAMESEHSSVECASAMTDTLENNASAVCSMRILALKNTCTLADPTIPLLSIAMAEDLAFADSVNANVVSMPMK